MQETQTPPEQTPSLKQDTSYTPLRTILLNALLAPGAGLVASLMAIVVMGLFRLGLGIPTPVELFGDFLLKHISVWTFIHLLQTFQPHPKTTPLGLALLGMLAAGTVLGWLYALLAWVSLPTRGYRPGRREWLTVSGFSIAMTLVAVILVWGELAQNLYGLTFNWAIITTILGLLIEFCVYGLVLCLAYRALLPKMANTAAEKQVLQRRQLLSRVGVATLTLGAGAGSFGLVKQYLSRYASYDGYETPATSYTAPITPNNEHYVVTQNTIDPTVDINLWRLEVTGLVNQPGSYTYDELLQLPSTSRPITLECIASGVYSHLISTAVWQGVTLRTLLEKHGGPASGATYIAFNSVDGYNLSLPLDQVLAEDALLAWRMNGVELPHRHGFPLRALIPGRYGEENAKWVTRIELTDHFIGGLYSDQGWYHGYLHTISRFDRPAHNNQQSVPAGRPLNLGGLAFAGNRGITKVEYSTDGGTTWQIATLQPPLSQDTWVFWSATWTPMLSGTYTLMVRATDGTGALQIAKKQGTVPNGATGYDTVMVTVA